MQTILLTGANGEVGHQLLFKIAESKKYDVITIDINDLDLSLKPLIKKFYKGSITDKKFLESVINKENFDIVIHLAAILSTTGEKNPELAHIVNVGGTSLFLSLVNKKAQDANTIIKFIFPSTIAVYGLPNLQVKTASGAIAEGLFEHPITMYGINKLYCENLGIYYSTHYALLVPKSSPHIDFRCVRFPGLISAITIPSGGTSDYAPEMIHTAAQGQSYESFVRADSTLPFMAMPDAAKALMILAEYSKEKLRRCIYNVASFSIKAKEIEDIVTEVFPNTQISYNPDPARQRIVDSWPAAIDDSNARNDWGWQPDFDLKKTFQEYLIPEIKNKYKKQLTK